MRQAAGGSPLACVPGVLVTNAKGLYDHLHKTGSIPSERQTLNDLLIAKDLQEAAAVIIRRVPTSYQLADILTKAMSIPPALALLLDEGLCSLVQATEDAVAEAHRAEPVFYTHRTLPTIFRLEISGLRLCSA